MRVTVFTRNLPRHISLIERLASIADEVFAVQECNTVYPGEVDDLYPGTDIMRQYFQHVIAAERAIFGAPRFGPRNARHLAIRAGDINRLRLNELQPALESDAYIVFGSGYIKAELFEFLYEHRAINVHMGVSPYYRGSSCNFWALYDQQPHMVGATIHLLGRGLDSGPILFHALPKAQPVTPFKLGMLAVKAALDGLVANLANGEVSRIVPVHQDRALEMRYSRNSEFTDQIAADYLAHLPSETDVGRALARRDETLYVNPYIAS